jgi:hypothetical protein
LGELTGEAAVAGAIAPYMGGYLAVERRNKRLLSINAAGQLDFAISENGIIELDALADVGHTVGERVLVLDEQSIAVSDGSLDTILVLTPAGELNEDWGFGGLFDLKALAITPPVSGLTGALDIHDNGFAFVDAVTDRLIRVNGGGLLTESNSVTKLNGTGGLFAGSTHSGSSLVVTKVAGDESADNKFVIADVEQSDLLFIDDAGPILVKKAAAASLSICPIEIKLGKGETFGESEAIILTNTGDTFLDLEGVQLSNTNPDIEIEKLECSGAACAAQTLNVSETSDFKVVWTATKAGQAGGEDEPLFGCFEESIIIGHNGVNDPTTCPVLLKSYFKSEVAPVVDTFGVLSYEFPPQSQGSKFTKEFTVRNAGCQSMPIAAKAIDFSLETGDFTLNTPGLPVQLGPGGIYKFTVTCKPFGPGKHKTQLNINIDGKNQPVTLTCITGPLLEFEPKDLKWMGVNVGDASFKDVTLSNVGGAPIKLTIGETQIIQDGNAYTMDLSLISEVIEVGESQVVSIKFAPAEYRNYPATLFVASNSISANEGGNEIPLLGSSLAVPELQPEVVDFGCVALGESATESVDIYNVGAGSLSLEMQEESLDGTFFKVVDYSEIELVNIQPKSFSGIELSCTPEAVGNYNAELSLKNESLGALQALKVPLTCRSGARCELSTQVVDFGILTWKDEPVTRSFVLKNTGCAEMSATVFQPIAADAVQEFKVITPCEPTSDSEGCGFSIAAPTDAETPETKSIEIVLDPSINPTAHVLEHSVRVESDCLDQNGPLLITLKAAIEAPEDVGGDAGTGDDDLGAEVQADGGGGQDGSGTGGDDEGCGCKTTPSEPRSIPLGSVLVLMLLALGLLRTRFSSKS